MASTCWKIFWRKEIMKTDANDAHTYTLLQDEIHNLRTQQESKVNKCIKCQEFTLDWFLCVHKYGNKQEFICNYVCGI